MAYPYTRSRARGEVADSDIEPSDSAATSPHPPGIFEGPSVETVDISGQVSTSSATGIVVAEIHAEREQSPGGSTTSRQPSATAAAARLPPEGPSILPIINNSMLQEKLLLGRRDTLQ